MQDPVLVSCKPLKSEYEKFKKFNITSNFTIGRGLQNSVIIPVLCISRNHCKFRKTDQDEWFIEDHSSFGITVNGNRIGKGETRKLSHGDVISLEPSQEFVYKFIDPAEDSFEIPKKRIKLEDVSNQCENIPEESIINKFEESQSHEIKHIEDKIQNFKQMQNTSKVLKEHLQLDMDRKIQQLENSFAVQIENLKGEKNEVERQKALLLEERDAQLANIKQDMEGKIAELMEQIKQHNETESELLKENNLLKEKLQKDRNEFLSELSRESSSKQDLLDKLESKIKEQEEIRLKEKQELEDMLRKETEQLKLAKELELKELEEQKKLREQELMNELNDMKKNLEEQVEQTEQQRLKAEQQLNEQMEQLKKLSDEDKAKMEQLVQEREEIQKKLIEAQLNAEKSLEEQRECVRNRETELAVLAAERIQKQAEQSGEVISSLQQQLENVRSQLQSVETEKNTLLESLCLTGSVDEGSTKQTTLAEVGELIESELQCSICAELFVAATTLNCSHTFCKYCITMWKKKKKDCPICRASITSECKSLVLDSFIEKMVQNLTEEVKVKRQELLKYREAEVAALTNPTRTTAAAPTSSRRRNTRTRTTPRTTTTTATNIASGIIGGGDGLGTAQIPTVDLTWIPTIPSTPIRPPMAPTRPHMAQRQTAVRQLMPVARPPVMARSPAPVANPVMQEMPQVYRIIQHNGQTLLVLEDGGAGTSQASRGHTTGATGAASAAAPAATGHPAAPSDNTHAL